MGSGVFFFLHSDGVGKVIVRIPEMCNSTKKTNGIRKRNAKIMVNEASAYFSNLCMWDKGFCVDSLTHDIHL